MKYFWKKYKKYQARQEEKRQALLRQQEDERRANALQFIVAQLQSLLKPEQGIPVIMVSYNNGVYVENMANQLHQHGIRPIVIDNASTHVNSLNILQDLLANQKIDLVSSSYNFGHMVGFLPDVYAILPEIFAYTDPDLQLNSNLPKNFLHILADLTQQFQSFKAAFALPYSLPNATAGEIAFNVAEHQVPIFVPEKTFTPAEWEKQYWQRPLKHDTLEIYAARTDTTFAVYRKSNYMYDFYDAVRVAGDFSAVHLPWFPELDVMSAADKQIYLQNNISATWGKS